MKKNGFFLEVNRKFQLLVCVLKIILTIFFLPHALFKSSGMLSESCQTIKTIVTRNPETVKVCLLAAYLVN